MSDQGFCLFETAIGHCAVAWGPRGIVGLQLPEGRAAATRRRMRERFPEAAEEKARGDVARTIRSVTALLAGQSADLSAVVLDMNGVPDFHRRAYKVARTIPAGQTRSYGEIAAKVGSPQAFRAVGQAMRRNPFPIVVPCHRVLAAGGAAGGFTAAGGIDTKRRMLEIEGAAISRFVKSTAALPYDGRRALRELRASDPTLARLIDGIGPLRLEVSSARTVFQALARAIVYQQLTGRAAATIHGRVCALFSPRATGFTPAQIQAASDEQLRGAGLSRAKVAALRDLAARTLSGELPTLAQLRRMDDDAVVEALTRVRGIGRWTVEMLLIFRLGRPDVLPVDDLGVRKGFAIAWGKRELPEPGQLARYGRRWAPWRSVAAWYLWRATD